MIKLHYLKHSRAQRILWFLEELKLPYELVVYSRDPETKLAPAALRDIHPLGKSPVLEDGDLKIAESGAMVDYLARTYGEGKFAVASDSPLFNQYQELLHYCEGSAILPLLLGMYARRLGKGGEPLLPRIQTEMGLHMGYLSRTLGSSNYFVGDSLTGVDIMMGFLFEGAELSGALAHFPNLSAYLKRIQTRPAYKAALEKGGSYNLATMED